MRIGTLALSLLATTGIFEFSHGQQTCIDDIADIYTMESQVADVSVHRTYILCPHSIYAIGTLDNNLDLQGFQVQPPLPLRPNMTIQCGDTGRRDELCWLAEGDVHVDATPFRGISDETVDSVFIEGIVFIAAKRYSLWATKPGDITFRDCAWRVRHTYRGLLDILRWKLKSLTHFDRFHTCRTLQHRLFLSCWIGLMAPIRSFLSLSRTVLSM
jgi:hypothetical protein